MLLVPSNASAMPQPRLLSDPFLQLPTQDSVSVVWFTEFQGTQHYVRYGANLEYQAIATTTKLSKVREDQTAKAGNDTVYYRDAWRHEAKAKGLPDQRLPYQVSSTHESGQTVTSDRFSLAPRPQPGTYIASNQVTVFSLLDTANGVVSSYRFDTRHPTSEIIKFDEFRLHR